MKVYVAYYCYDYASSQILGIFTKPEDALEAITNCELGDYKDYFEVELDKVHPPFELVV
jgi:hypothetical protein